MSFEDIRANGGRSTDPEPGPSMDRFKRVVSIFLATDEAKDAKVLSDRKPALPFSAWLKLAVVVGSLLYIAIEWRWNLKLVGAVFGGELSAQEMHDLVNEGRLLAAFGLVWAFSRGFVSKAATASGLAISSLVLALAVVVAYKAIDRGYESFVDAIPAAAANKLYKASAYRSLAYTDGGDVDASLRDPVTSVLWPLRLLDPKGVQQIEFELIEKAGESAEVSAQAADALWPKLEQKLALLSRRDEILAGFDRQYKQYIEASQKIGSFLPRGDKRIEDFRAMTGLQPNARATKEEFARALLGSHIVNMRQLGEAYLSGMSSAEDTVVYSVPGLEVKLSDLDGVQTKEQFTQLIGVLAKQGATKKLASANAQTDKETRAAVAAAVLPPVAMALSALAIVLNIGGLAAAMASLLPGIRALPSLVWPIAAFCLAVLAPKEHPLPGLESSLEVLATQVPFASAVIERIAALEGELLRTGLVLLDVLPR